MSEWLLNLCRECYATGGMTVDQLEQNIADVLAGRYPLSAPTRALRREITCALHAQIRYVTPDDVAVYVEAAA